MSSGRFNQLLFSITSLSRSPTQDTLRSPVSSSGAAGGFSAELLSSSHWSQTAHLARRLNVSARRHWLCRLLVLYLVWSPGASSFGPSSPHLQQTTMEVEVAAAAAVTRVADTATSIDPTITHPTSVITTLLHAATARQQATATTTTRPAVIGRK